MKTRALAGPALVALLALGACAQPSNTAMLQMRAALSLTPTETCNRLATIENLPEGVRILVPQEQLFAPGHSDLTQCGQYALSSAMQAMLDPRIMQVVIEPDADYDAPGYVLPRQRAEAVKRFFTDAGFTGTQPPVLVQPADAASTGIMRVLLATAAAS